MNAGDQDYFPLGRAQTVHPALSEGIIGAFGNLEPRGPYSLGTTINFKKRIVSVITQIYFYEHIFRDTKFH